MCKLNFFLVIVKTLTPFLTKYQTSEPLIAYRGVDLSNLLVSLMRRFIKRHVIESFNGDISEIISVDVSNKAIHVVNTEVDMGYVTEKHLKELLNSKKN